MADIILGIESSCDDTSAAVIRDGWLLSNVIASQQVHKSFGGVVPELASRAHEMNIVPVVSEALSRAGVAAADLTATEAGLDRLMSTLYQSIPMGAFSEGEKNTPNANETSGGSGYSGGVNGNWNYTYVRDINFFIKSIGEATSSPRRPTTRSWAKPSSSGPTTISLPSASMAAFRS